ncbi:hypothetical protein E3T26_06965 [Cryobacterium sp. TMT1-21]|uniref:hypothetical protein n=1 Tax=Cryobacterium sp. TMT1-21 TaxID=1259234 RepID=UPI00106C8D0D|nr:hypothetical protein [Cryobacterium sp. TMT1-21]TFD15517.1 hypothetical protein E3T26_06965 [Cryobacterium sp. TMT1-21]
MDLGAFGEFWNSSIGVFWNRLEWGSVAQWVSGLLTAGSLYLGLTILRRDRDKADLLSADAFVVWSDTIKITATVPNYFVTVSSFNGGDMPIINPYLMAYSNPGFKPINMLVNRKANDIGVIIEGKERNQISFDSGNVDPETLKLFIVFRDARGYEWRRTLDFGKYMSQRQINWRYHHIISNKEFTSEELAKKRRIKFKPVQKPLPI